MSKEMRQHIDKFNKFRISENLNISDVSDSFLQPPYTVGDLKRFLNDLPDNMSVIVMNDNETGVDSLKSHYIKVFNSKKLDLKSPTTGEDYNVLLISVDK
jgi:hypothetical protein